MKKLILIFIILLPSFSIFSAEFPKQETLLVSVDAGGENEYRTEYGFRNENEEAVTSILLKRTITDIENSKVITASYVPAEGKKIEIYWDFKTVYPCRLYLSLGTLFSGSEWYVEYQNEGDTVKLTSGQKNVLVEHKPSESIISQGAYEITSIVVNLWKPGIHNVPKSILRQDITLSLEFI